MNWAPLDYPRAPHNACGALLGQSALLSRLSTQVQQRLLPHLTLVELPAGSMPMSSGPVERAYFPIAGILALVLEMADGAGAQVAVIGKEGLLGLSHISGSTAVPIRAVVQCAGHALALPRERLIEEFARGGEFMHHLLRFGQALMTQTAQLVVCNRHHSIEQQLCRLLLLSLDRVHGPEVRLTQEFASRLLGVRREGVTEATGHLRKAGVIACRRGVFAALDRSLLERHACGCYAAVRDEYARLLPVCRPAPAPIVPLAVRSAPEIAIERSLPVTVTPAPGSAELDPSWIGMPNGQPGQPEAPPPVV